MRQNASLKKAETLKTWATVSFRAWNKAFQACLLHSGLNPVSNEAAQHYYLNGESPETAQAEETFLQSNKGE